MTLARIFSEGACCTFGRYHPLFISEDPMKETADPAAEASALAHASFAFSIESLLASGTDQ
jgi:hypothetical protein